MCQSTRLSTSPLRLGTRTRTGKRCPLPTRLHRPTSNKPNRTSVVTAAAAASPAAQKAAQTTGQALQTWFLRLNTGVPIREYLEAMPMEQAGAAALILIVGAIGLALLSQGAFRLLTTLANKRLDAIEKNGEILHFRPRLFIVSAVAALNRPVGVLVPYVAFTFALTVATCITEMAIQQYTSAAAAATWLPVVNALKDASQLLQDATEVMGIAAITWFLLSFKDRIVKLIIHNSSMNGGKGHADNLQRILNPTSNILSWVTVTLAVIASISICGFDVAPLLTLGSVTSLAVAFAAQSTVANVVSAFLLYVNRPFIEGDRVHLKTLGGSTIIKGTVKSIMPIQTKIMTDDFAPIYISNKDIVNMLVSNESKRGKQRDIESPLLDFAKAITIRYQDIEKVAAIQEEATAYLKNRPDVEKKPGISLRCRLEGFNLYGAELSIKYTLLPEYYLDRSSILADVLLHIESIVRKHGALLAMQRGVRYPESAVAHMPPVAS